MLLRGVMPRGRLVGVSLGAESLCVGFRDNLG